MNLIELPDGILARLYFRLLWQRYDAGGVSMGRSLRAQLVENYIAFVPLENSSMYDGVGMEHVAEEAGTRSPVFRGERLLGLGIEHLDSLPKDRLPFLCISALQAWYALHQGEEDRNGPVANPLEKAAIDNVCSIMDVPDITDLHPSDEDLMRVGHYVQSHLLDLGFQQARAELLS